MARRRKGVLYLAADGNPSPWRSNPTPRAPLVCRNRCPTGLSFPGENLQCAGGAILIPVVTTTPAIVVVTTGHTLEREGRRVMHVDAAAIDAPTHLSCRPPRTL